ncbi:hypothetical protein G8764_13920 [Pseudomaricurvus alcaniphilus]|uniref:DUF6491 family protein n=1 Tax=Pseudomaricurvus alcaniphilus TaxID=1166482 RepID=UPI00140B349C|nr:DUF6491 family protein [Pseudomaricurvus alcaniphilus]NHN38400.1 hypothetical protein [Pseudomaricurvus alcaniphilus]
MRYLLRRVWVVGFAAILSSCASTDRPIPSVPKLLSESTGQSGRACIRQSQINGYGILDDDVISIDAGRRYYLATVVPRCNDLELSMQAIFKSASSELCGKRMDKVITREESCYISDIFEFANRKEAFAAFEAAVEQRKKIKAELKK